MVPECRLNPGEAAVSHTELELTSRGGWTCTNFDHLRIQVKNFSARPLTDPLTFIMNDLAFLSRSYVSVLNVLISFIEEFLC